MGPVLLVLRLVEVRLVEVVVVVVEVVVVATERLLLFWRWPLVEGRPPSLDVALRS